MPLNNVLKLYFRQALQPLPRVCWQSCLTKWPPSSIYLTWSPPANPVLPRNVGTTLITSLSPRPPPSLNLTHSWFSYTQPTLSHMLYFVCSVFILKAYDRAPDTPKERLNNSVWVLGDFVVVLFHTKVCIMFTVQAVFHIHRKKEITPKITAETSGLPTIKNNSWKGVEQPVTVLAKNWKSQRHMTVNTIITHKLQFRSHG